MVVCQRFRKVGSKVSWLLSSAPLPASSERKAAAPGGPYLSRLTAHPKTSTLCPSSMAPTGQAFRHLPHLLQIPSTFLPSGRRGASVRTPPILTLGPNLSVTRSLLSPSSPSPAATAAWRRENSPLRPNLPSPMSSGRATGTEREGKPLSSRKRTSSLPIRPSF